MQEKQLNRIMRLVRNTGDRLVILDRESDETMVMMNLDEYENLIQGGCDCDCEDDPDGEEWPAGDDDDEEDELDEFVDAWERKSKDVRPDEPIHLETPETVEEAFEPLEEFEIAEPVVEPMTEEPVAPEVPLVTNPVKTQPLHSGSMASVAAILSEEPLGDVPHEEVEEPFLLEPVE